MFPAFVWNAYWYCIPSSETLGDKVFAKFKRSMKEMNICESIAGEVER